MSSGSEKNVSKWQVDDAKPEYDLQIRKLFKDVFKEEMSAAHWEWKYGEGRGAGIVVSDGDEVVAFYGGTERRVLFKGEAVCAFQSVDSMVGERHRGTLSKKGPFFLSVAAFQDRYLGFGRPYQLSFGFPHARAMKLAERLGMYVEVGTLVDISWSKKQCSDFTFIEFDFDSSEHRQLLKQLWETMAAQFSQRSIGVRDMDYLCHRYLNHPVFTYNVHLVFNRANQRLLGLLVTRQIEDRLLLVDVVADRSDFSSLVNFGRDFTTNLGCSDLYGWLTQVDCDLVSGTDAVVSDTPLRLPFGVYRKGLDPADVKDKWFFMCGDSDFL